MFVAALIVVKRDTVNTSFRLATWVGVRMFLARAHTRRVYRGRLLAVFT